MSTQFRRMKASTQANAPKRKGWMLDEVFAEIEQETGGQVFEPIPQRRVDDFPGMPTQMGTPPAPPARVSQVVSVGVSRGMDPKLADLVAQRVDPSARMGRTEAAIIVDGVIAAQQVGAEVIQALALGEAQLDGSNTDTSKEVGACLWRSMHANRDDDFNPDGGASCPPSPIAAFPPLPDEPARPLPPSDVLDAVDLADVVAAQGWGVDFYEELEMRLGDERAEVFGQIALTLGLVGLDDEPEHAADMVARGYRFLARAKKAIKRVSSLLNDAA